MANVSTFDFGISSGGNYFGNGSLGDCQFGASGVTQSGHTVDIDNVLSKGAESSGGVSQWYGTGPISSGDWYGLTVTRSGGGYSDTYAAGGKVKQNSPNSGSDIYVDGDMVVANFTNLTIDAACGLTTAHPCRGMLIYCTGDLTVASGGYISMSSRGPWANPASDADGDGDTVPPAGIKLGYITGSGTSSLAASDFTGCGAAATAAVSNQPSLIGNGTIWTFERIGADGAPGTYNNTNGYFQGADGSAGGAGETGGGGGGGGIGVNSSSNGLGAAGTCFAGGSGGGAKHEHGTANIANASPYGGPGGFSDTAYDCGSGNPADDPDNSPSYREGKDGCGGLMILIVGGNVAISGGSQCNGSGGNDNSGGSGGGNQLILYAGSYSNASGVCNGGESNGEGGDGGNGSMRSAQVAEAA